jgi:hypothetical protein
MVVAIVDTPAHAIYGLSWFALVAKRVYLSYFVEKENDKY